MIFASQARTVIKYLGRRSMLANIILLDRACLRLDFEVTACMVGDPSGQESFEDESVSNAPVYPRATRRREAHSGSRLSVQVNVEG